MIMEKENDKSYITKLSKFAYNELKKYKKRGGQGKTFSAIGINCYLVILDSSDGKDREKDIASFDDWDYAVDFSHAMGSIFENRPNYDLNAVKFETDYREFDRLKDLYYENKISIDEIKNSAYYITTSKILDYLLQSDISKHISMTNDFEVYLVFNEKRISPNIYKDK